MKIFVTICTRFKVECKNNPVDPCLLFTHNEEVKLMLLVTDCVDVLLVAGRKEEIKVFKKELKKIYKISYLGHLKRNLRIWFKCIESNDEENAKKNIWVM